jgi:hypothetical protein
LEGPRSIRPRVALLAKTAHSPEGPPTPFPCWGSGGFSPCKVLRVEQYMAVLAFNSFQARVREKQHSCNVNRLLFSLPLSLVPSVGREKIPAPFLTTVPGCLALDLSVYSLKLSWTHYFLALIIKPKKLVSG